MSLKLLIKQKFILALLFITFSATFLIYKQSLTYYFLQDDWFILNQLNAKNITHYFIPNYADYYRPLGLQTFFYLSHTAFGLNPFGYHLIPLLIHFINTFLIFMLLFRIRKRFIAASLGAFIYATAAFNFIAISWPAASWNIIGAFFILSAANLYIYYIDRGKWIYQIAVFILFLLALLSNEFAIILPLFIFIIAFFFLHKTISIIYKKNKYLFMSMAFVVFTYIGIRFVIFRVPTEGVYRPEFNLKIFKTLFWYFLWMLNIPEDVKYQILLSKLQLTTTIVKNGGILLLPAIVTAVASILYSIYYIFIAHINKKVILGSFLIFCFFLSPIIFLPNHTYPYYLTLPAIGFVILASEATAEIKSRIKPILIGIFFVLWLVSSYFSVSVERELHWLTHEQLFSKNAIEKIQNTLPRAIEHDSNILIISNNQLILPSLSDQDALQVIFHDQSIKTIYSKDNSGFENLKYIIKL